MGGIIVNESNTEAFGDGMDSATARALEETGLLAEGHAKRICPVDTGQVAQLRHALRDLAQPYAMLSDFA